jgi:hypothetical protein
MKGTGKLLFVVNLCATYLGLCAIDTLAQTPGVEVKRRDRVTAAESPTQPKGFELRCRGGPAAFAFEKIGDDRQLPGGEIQVVLRLIFKASPRAAGVTGGGLEPGTCSWVDRPLNDKEPREIWFDTLANAQLKQALKGTGVDRSLTAAENFPDAITIPAYLSDGNHYWSFFVINAFSQYFAAQSYKPWKPSLKGQASTPKDLVLAPPTRRGIKP